MRYLSFFRFTLLIALVSLTLTTIACVHNTSLTEQSPESKLLSKDKKSDSASKFKMDLALAEEGDVAAKARVAHAYKFGKGVEKDLKEAFNWSLSAAKDGDVLYQEVTGLAYLRGSGTEKNVKDGLDWLEKAAQANSGSANYNLYSAYRKGDASVEKKKAMNYLIRSSELNFYPAYAALSWHYERGQDVEVDHDKSISYAKQASILGSADGFWLLALKYGKGIGVSPDYTLAMVYYRLALKLAPSNTVLIWFTDENTKFVRETWESSPASRQQEIDAIVKTWEVGLPLPTVSKKATEIPM